MRLGACLLIVAACGGGSPPEIHGLVDQTATVGQELVIQIDGTDAEGDRITYGVHADISLQGTGMLTTAPSGMGVFRFTPLAEQIGQHSFDFTATDSSGTTTVTIQINVVAAVGSAPVFRQPLGTGTVLTAQCADLDIVVEDMDSPTVMIAQEAPDIAGAQLTTVDGLDATWHWCPTAQQIAQSNRYTLELSADDGDNPKTIKDYRGALAVPQPERSGRQRRRDRLDDLRDTHARYGERSLTARVHADARRYGRAHSATIRYLHVGGNLKPPLASNT